MFRHGDELNTKDTKDTKVEDLTLVTFVPCVFKCSCINSLQNLRKPTYPSAVLPVGRVVADPAQRGQPDLQRDGFRPPVSPDALGASHYTAVIARS